MVSVAVVSVKGTKRRTRQRRRSQKERRPRHGSGRRSRSRKSMAKKRKPSEPRKHRPLKRKRRAPKGSLRFDAKKLKGAGGAGRFLSREAKGLMVTFVENIYKQVWSEAERLRRESHEALVSPVHVRAALQSVMPERSWKQAAFRNRHRRKAPAPQGKGFKAPQVLRACAMPHEGGV